MKRFLVVLVLILGFCTSCFATTRGILHDNYQAIFSPQNGTWHAGGIIDDGIVLTKKVQYGNGAYSQYFYENGKLAFTLKTDYEFIKNGLLVSVNNNELKYTKIVYTENGFEEVTIPYQELQYLFPDAEIIKMSKFEQNKYWTKKSLFNKKKILLVNDTKKFFYNPTCISPKAQTSQVRGLITLYRYGKYTFNHFGEHKGKFLIYVKL